MNKILLNGDWQIRGFDGQHGNWQPFVAVDLPDTNSFFPATVPGEVHLDLEKAGELDDLLIGKNCLKARWVEEEIWVYRKAFILKAKDINLYSRMVFLGLDLNSEIYLNGEKVGEHNNAFCPCKLDVSGKLKVGENIVAVRIDSGLYSCYEKPIYKYSPNYFDHLTKRVWQRKAQYQFSWDWNPRLINVGITKDVYIETSNSVFVDQTSINVDLNKDYTQAKLDINVFTYNPNKKKANLKIKVKIGDITKEIEVKANFGDNKDIVSVVIDNPKLWFPRPFKSQYLYKVEITVSCDDEKILSEVKKTGIRKVTINKEKHPKQGNYFIIEVNGEPIFAKGGNYVPLDIIDAKVDRERIEKAVKLAVGANFNMLRIWGGAYYADHNLLEICDELGIMAWHDCVFACAQYPGDDYDFVQNVSREITYNVRELSHHASMCVWCGNNEIEWIFNIEDFKKQLHLSDYSIYHRIIPDIIKAEDPTKPYWPSSPYSEDGNDYNSDYSGDQHPWNVSILDEKNLTNFWLYRDLECRFPNEGGVLGAGLYNSMEEYMPKKDLHAFSPSWQYHDNSINFHNGGLTFNLVRDWIGFDVKDIELEDYLFMSGVLLSEGLYEYISSFRARKFDSASAIFWMYNDSWPSTHSWTIIDYYQRKLLAYYPVKRAFSDVNVFPVLQDKLVKIIAVNDTEKSFKGIVKYGKFNTENTFDIKEVEVEIPANGKLVIDEYKNNNENAFAVLIKDSINICQNRLLQTKFKDLDFKKSNIKIEKDGEYIKITSKNYVWACSIDFEGKDNTPDNIFDLLPNIPYYIKEENINEIKALSDVVISIRDNM